MDVCPGCGSLMAKTARVTAYCDEKGYPVHLVRMCSQCAELFATGSLEARMGLFDRIGEVESAFLVCQTLEKKLAVH